MDRPEWVAVNPTAPEAYCCLTNNSRRGLINEDGSIRTKCRRRADDPQRAQPARAEQTTVRSCAGGPRAATTGATTFAWDLYVMAGNPTGA